MLSGFNWAAIANGATFQALANVLLLHDDPKTIVFTKEGPDGGLDAISSSWMGAFQAKFHANARPHHAFADARDELKNIAKYRTPGHARHEQWNKVTGWTLLTNAAWGPDDALDWKKDIVPEFAKLGLTAECEGAAWFDKRLAAHPDVAGCFFEGKTRCFQSLAEFRSRVEDGILSNALEQPMLERETAVQRILAFARDPQKRLLLLHGTGGVGKTRFLYEAAHAASQLGLFGAVYCATPAVEVSQEWYRGIVPETPAIVLVDEPQDPKFVDVLLTELAGRANKWKVIVATRSPNHPVLQPLRNQRLQVVARPDLELKALHQDAATKAALSLVSTNLKLSSHDAAVVAEWLARISGGVPIWIVIGVRLLSDRGDLRELPVDRWGVASAYVNEIVTRGPSTIANAQQLMRLLRWIALVQPLNRQDPSVIAFLAKECVFESAGDVERALNSLRHRRVVSCYGIDDRLVEVRPDVMRDVFVREWLTLPGDPDDPSSLRGPSADATQLVKRIVNAVTGKDFIPYVRQVIETLGRLEFLMEIRLLDPLAEWTVESARNAADAAAQMDVLEVAKVFGPFRPKVFASIIDTLNSSDVPDGYREIE